MSTKSEIPPTEDHQNVVAGIVTRFGQIAILLIVQAAILFLAAGRLNWTWAWVFLGIYLVSVSINSAFMTRPVPRPSRSAAKPRRRRTGTRSWVVSGAWPNSLCSRLWLVWICVSVGPGSLAPRGMLQALWCLRLDWGSSDGR